MGSAGAGACPLPCGRRVGGKLGRGAYSLAALAQRDPNVTRPVTRRRGPVKLLVLIYAGCMAITVALIVWLVLAFTTGEGG